MMIVGELLCTTASKKAVLPLTAVESMRGLACSLRLLPASLLLQLGRDASVTEPRGVWGPRKLSSSAGGHAGSAAGADLLAASISRPSMPPVAASIFYVWSIMCLGLDSCQKLCSLSGSIEACLPPLPSRARKYLCSPEPFRQAVNHVVKTCKAVQGQRRRPPTCTFLSWSKTKVENSHSNRS